MAADSETIQALRGDVAHQIARHIRRLGFTQLAASKQLKVPQPTLSKIANGDTVGLSLELLLRIAVRAGMRMTLHTGFVPQEAGAFVSAGLRSPTRVYPSRVAASAGAAMRDPLRLQTPAERLEIFLEHNELTHEFRASGLASEAIAKSIPPSHA
ncbi:MAG: XRE family transcriptional regulator [Proteobacteria bacterium]|nr:XRE family transcriptional regulator [Pseudomonadota bacterium]